MMFDLLKDQLIDDAVTRVEQSRISYNLQTEEFRSLNANLQTYLDDIKIIDDENEKLQETIEEIRTKYILTLENHLKSLPNDFREQSQTLTNVHLERYRLKSRIRRYIIERDEWKRRIKFLINYEKDQMKYLNQLEKQDRYHRQEFQKLNEQYQRLNKSLINEKELYRQSMIKVDQLQIQLEQCWIDRSKTEFQIQSLKEEVQLMETTKEFLSEECDTILSSRHDANEYFLSKLYESITRIRNDFQQLNQTQLQQIEQDYQQMLQILEENLLANITNKSNQIIHPSEYEQLQNEQQNIDKEWTILNDQNQILSERILTMENNLYTIRHERMQQLIIKDHEFQQSKMELQTLNDKLVHLTEYDRNLKFELTLYRGVLESEYQRRQVTNNSMQLNRPTTLRTNHSNTNTDRRARLTNARKLNKLNDQQQESILSAENRVSSDEDLLADGRTTKNSLNIEKLFSGESLWQQLMQPFNKIHQTEQTSTNVNIQDDRKPSRSSSYTRTSPSSVPQSPSVTSLVCKESQKSPSTPSLEQGNQSVKSPNRQLSSESRSSPINTISLEFEYLQSSTISSKQYQAASELQRSRNSSITETTAMKQQQISSQTSNSPSTPSYEYQPSSRTSSINSKTAFEQKESSTFTTSPIIPDDQSLISTVHSSTLPQAIPSSSRTSSISSKTSPDLEKSSITIIERQPSPITDIQRSSRTSSISSKALSDIHESTKSSNSSQQLPPTSDVQKSSLHENKQSSCTSSISSHASLDQQKSSFFTATSTVSEQKQIIDDTSPLTSSVPEDTQILSNLQQASSAAPDEQEKPLSITIDDYQITSSTDNFDDPNQGNYTFIENDDNIQYEDSVSYTTDEKDHSEVDHHEHRQSVHSIEEISTTDADILSSDKSIEFHSSFIALTSVVKESEIQLEREEPIDSSHRKLTEENDPIENISSTNQINPLLPQITVSKQSSADTSLTDVEEVDPTPSLEHHENSSENEDFNLVMIIQDLRYVFQTLANENELIEINNELPERILDHLECRDQFIRTLFTNFIQKYLVQTAVQTIRSNTLDWFEFRDILFPLITGRYTERHIRKLFQLFDTAQDGYLSLQEIAELLQILHANDTIDLAQIIINEFDTDHDGKLNVDELLEAIKQHNDINEHTLSEEIQTKECFNQSVNDDLTITLEVPIINFPSRMNDRLIEGIKLLSQIFHRLGANTNTHQLDIHTENLLELMTNEFVQYNIKISRDDLQTFIQLYLDEKIDTNSSINWIEFRDFFLPIIYSNCYSSQHLQQWFQLFDKNRTGFITREQANRILRLLQLSNLSEILQQLDQITDDISSWTFDDLIYIIDENTSHFIPDMNQIASFDNQWLSKNIF